MEKGMNGHEAVESSNEGYISVNRVNKGDW
jgi:hypothetical protein